MAKKIAPPRGMNDILPVAAARREAIIHLLAPIYARWGFMGIECPAMETIDRLIGSDGGDNEKLIFQILRRGLGQEALTPEALNNNTLVDMGLRFDLTVPLARFYASHHSQLPRVCKFLQHGPVWRAERPQKGRFRQFMQWDADIVGATEGLAEIELLLCSAEALSSLGLEGFVIRHNDRRLLRTLVASAGVDAARADDAFIAIDKLDKIGLEGIEKDLLGRGFKQETVSKLSHKLSPFIGEQRYDVAQALAALDIAADAQVSDAVSEVHQQVSQRMQGGQIVFDPTLVRGMGYYTGQIFEVQYQDYRFSIAGGGRYDGMIGRFLGKDVPAVGFSLGFDRILTVLADKARWPDSQRPKKLLLLTAPSQRHAALSHAQAMRQQGWDVNLEYQAKNLKQQLLEYKQVGYSHYCMFHHHDPAEIRPIG